MDIDLARLADAFHGINLVVVGDALLDVYLEGRVGRLCREAPVPIVEIDRRLDVPGGAANAAVNARALGAHVALLGVVGDDAEGGRLTAALDAYGVDTGDLLIQRGRRTPAKHRVLGDGQMLARFDQSGASEVDSQTEAELITRLTRRFTGADAVILSNYAQGVFTPAMTHALAYLQRRAARVIVADSRTPGVFAAVGVTAVKPNYAEALQLLGSDSRDAGRGRAEAIIAHEEQLLAASGAGIVATTLDADGAVVLERGRTPYRTYARPARSSRACGGGDTFVAAFALALAAGADTPEAAELAAAAASVAVAKDGTSTCSAFELRQTIAGGEKRVLDLAALSERLAAERAHGRRIVFTNGCFDILHRGHVTLLNRAKGLGEVLVVGVNSDASVRRLKGPARPINSVDDRIKVLAALSYVDHVVAFEGDSPTEVIRAVRPDIYVKGGDYTRETLPEAPLVESLGGAVCILPYLEDRSTTGLIERIRSVRA